jgi:molybdate transport system permease protein
MTTTLFVLASGTPLAYLVSRRHLRIAALLEILIDLPTVQSPAVAGLALLMAFGRRGLLGGTLDALGLQDTLYDAG